MWGGGTRSKSRSTWIWRERRQFFRNDMIMSIDQILKKNVNEKVDNDKKNTS